MTSHAASPGWEGAPPKEVCIVMLSALGDAVHVLPVVTALKRAWPETRITWVIQPTPHALVRDHPCVDDFIVFERIRGLGGWRGFVEVRRALAGRRFDLLIGLQVYLKAGVITAFADARVKLGFDRARARDGQWLFTDRRVPARPPQHVQDQYFEFLDFLGVDARPIEWRLDLDDAERAAQERFFAELDRPACALVVATSKPEKDWSPGGYARVCEAIEERHGLRPILVGGPSLLERSVADRILEETRAHVIDALDHDVRKLLWLLDGSALVVSPDTGPLHMSRAIGTPVVGLFGYTNPKRSGPYRAYRDLIVDGYASHPGEEYPISARYRDGMKRVTVDRVLKKVQVAMDRYVNRGAPG